MSVDLSPATTRLIAEPPAADELQAFVAWMGGGGDVPTNPWASRLMMRSNWLSRRRCD
jgi:hypothetical protein